jgi:tetratricopeptide (TPR) repeat protein
VSALPFLVGILTSCNASSATRARVERGDHLVEGGHHAEAAECLAAGVPTRSVADQRALIAAGARWAKDAFERGELIAARDLFRSVVDMCRPRGEGEVLAHALANLGNAEIMLSNHQSADQCLQESLALADRSGAQEISVRVRIDLALLRYDLRQYDEAELLLDDALRAANGPSFRWHRARARLVQGCVLRQQGDFDGAERPYDEAVAQARELATGGEHDARKLLEDALRNQGELFKARGDPESLARARALLEEARTLARELNTPLQAAMSLSHLAEVDLRRGSLDAAQRGFEEALATFERLGFADGAARAHLFLGDLWSARGAWSTAATEYDAAQLAYGEARDREWRRLAWLGLARCAHELGKETESRALLSRATEVVLSMRHDLSPRARDDFERMTVEAWMERVGPDEHFRRLEDQLARQSASEPGPLAELVAAHESLSELERRVDATRAGAPLLELLAEQEADMIRSRDEYRRLVEELYRSHPDAVPDLDLGPQRLVEMMDDTRFLEKRALVLYFVTRDYTLVFAGRRGDVETALIQRSAAELTRLVQAFRAAIHRDRDRDLVRNLEIDPHVSGAEGGSAIDLAAELYELLVRPIEAQIADAEAVGVVPMGQLSLLPFHALVRSNLHRREFWLERQDVVYLSALNAEHTLRERRGVGLRERSPRVSIFADPTEDLVHARQEALAIQSIFPAAKLYSRRAALPLAFQEAWTGSDILHVAAHGVFPRGGSEAYLQFWPPGPEGRLVAKEVLGLARGSEPKLIVLSACSTALADLAIEPTRTHIETLAQAFAAQQASVGHTVIATLWDISDRSTAVLMARFYAELNAGLPPHAALVAAQRAMMDGSRVNMPGWEPQFAQLHHWASFVHIGSWE